MHLVGFFFNLVGFIIRIYHDARSSERQIFNNVKFATCFGYRYPSSGRHFSDVAKRIRQRIKGKGKVLPSQARCSPEGG